MVLLPLVLWAMLWFSLGANDIRGIVNPTSFRDFLESVRAAFPFLAILLAWAIIFSRLRQQHPQGLWFFSPLGLAFLYGLVGVISFYLTSLHWLGALQWALAYLSVPLVLWAGLWARWPNSLEYVHRVINFNSFLMLLAVVVLCGMALVYLDLGKVLLNPSAWLECRLRDHILPVGVGEIRSTGIGRYAAMGGIIALSGIWQRQWRLISSILFVASVVLLLTSGARTAFVGFVPAAALIVLLYGGKKAILAGAGILLLLAPLVWGTGIYQPFLAKCALRGVTVGPAPQEAPQSQEPAPQEAPQSQELAPQEAPQSQEPAPQEAPQSQEQIAPGESEQTGILEGFVEQGSSTLTGRVETWTQGLELVQESPALGLGFHADRRGLGTHMHNAFMHALIQTGILGTIPFLAAFIWVWLLLIRVLTKLRDLPVVHKHLTIQVAGVLTFLSIRAIPESTGAFFGVDWLLLAPLLLYLQLINRRIVNHAVADGARSAETVPRRWAFWWGPRVDVKSRGSQDSMELEPSLSRPDFKVLGVRIDAVQTPDATAQMERWIQERNGSHFIAVTGMHGVMEAQNDPHFKQMQNAADLVVPDGISMVWLGRYRHGYPLQRRATGSDIMAGFCKETGAKYRHFLYGGTPAGSEKLERVLRERYGVQVVGTYVPPFRPLTPEEDLEVRATINKAQPDVLWVGLSTPKQERWMFEHRATLQVPVMLGVGAAFDFLAGTKRQAPRWMGDHGLEWFYRFMSEPRRLWRRVLVQVPRFVFYVTLETLGLKKFD
jgi:N-acetylglucosaminyldiphosphoundecaprenol N-acetyl-beta-D-mannosaminyltransferase